MYERRDGECIYNLLTFTVIFYCITLSMTLNLDLAKSQIDFAHAFRFYL